MRSKHCLITIDNQYLSLSPELSLMLSLQKMIEQHKEEEQGAGEYIPISIQSTSRTFMGTKSLFFRKKQWKTADRRRFTSRVFYL